MKYEYEIYTDYHIEKLIDMINEKAAEGWRICYILQEHAYSKVILEREHDVNI